MNDSKDTAAELAELRDKYEALELKKRELSERVFELYTLYSISKNLSLSLQLTDLFETIIQSISASMSLNDFSIMLLSDDKESLHVQASHGINDKKIMEVQIPVGEGTPGKIIKNRKPIVITDLTTASDFFYYKGSNLDHGSYLGVPIKDKAGEPIGVLNAHNPEKDGFAKKDINLFEAVAEHVGIAIENAWNYQRTQELSNRDHLTGLYNRRYFFERFEREIERAQRYDRILALMISDIDLFKEFNDTYGHVEGDNAIKRVANTIQEELRKVDILARYGGEEFVILLPETDKESAALVAEKIRRAVEKIEFQNGHKITMTIGVASYPLEAQDPLDLLERADKALYYGKASGRNRVSTKVPSDITDTE